MESKIRDAVWRGKSPACKMTLHNLKSRRQPFNRSDHFFGILRRWHRPAELKDDFGLNARLHQRGKFEYPAILIGEMYRV